MIRRRSTSTLLAFAVALLMLSTPVSAGASKPLVASAAPPSAPTGLVVTPGEGGVTTSAAPSISFVLNDIVNIRQLDGYVEIYEGATLVWGGLDDAGPDYPGT
jgi:hypothetical protein